MDIQNRSSEQIYLEFCNDFLTIAGMASYYDMNPELLKDIISIGKIKHENNVKDVKNDGLQDGINEYAMDYTLGNFGEIDQYKEMYLAYIAGMEKQKQLKSSDLQEHTRTPSQIPNPKQADIQRSLNDFLDAVKDIQALRIWYTNKQITDAIEADQRLQEFDKEHKHLLTYLIKVLR